MKKQKRTANQYNPPIKGYLPIRIALPPIYGNAKKDKQHSFTSFIYIKEHIQKSSQNSGTSGAGSSTVFVANAPANGPIRTDLFLRALFEPYGDIQRVTVARDLRSVGSSSGEEAVEIFREAALQGLDYDCSGMLASNNNDGRRGDGKFAHVVFASNKEMRKALKTLKREIDEAEDLFVMRLDGDRMEELGAETTKLRSDVKQDSDSDDSQDEEEEAEAPKELTGIHAVAAQARKKAARHLSRQKLLQLCNDAMANFEDDEAEAAHHAKMAAEQPDEDGFITVSHSSTPSFGVTNDLEEDRHQRRKAGKRHRKRKAGGSGADELQDFYRFQLKESRKKEVTDLKKRFEEDLKKVKKMKEERAYRPF